MATFEPYRPFKGFNVPQKYTEPCMQCFASVTYTKDETKFSPTATGKYSIICPNCGKEMIVNFQNIRLL